MTNGPEKSDPSTVAKKPANNPGRSGAESVERREGAKGNSGEQLTYRTPSRKSVSSGLLRVRERARRDKKERFTALLHHVTGRSQHNALDALATGITRTKVNWISDCDIRSYFDSVSHEWLVRFIEHRIGDPRMIRLIRKWLKAGVHDDGKWSTSDTGTPHGAVVTPRTHKVISADRYFAAAVGAR
jgi:hypothetical protein